MEPLVDCQNVQLTFPAESSGGTQVLRDISFAIYPGAFYFLTGPSGAGKSSLLKMLYLSLLPSAGHLRIFGQDIGLLPRHKFPKIRRRVGVVFQDFRLLRHLSALDNVALPLRLIGAKKSQIRGHVEELLAWVGLEDRMHAFPDQLSGGEQQRVAIARAVVSKPGLLLADEPTGNVDDKMAMKLMRLFEELNKMGTTILFATHNEQLISRFSHPVWRLENGGLTAHSPMAAMAKGYAA